MHEQVSNPGCGINSQGQEADPHGGNLIEERLLAILETKKKKENTYLPGADCTRIPRQGVQGAWHGAVYAARLWLGGMFITKLEDTASSSLTSSLMAQCLHHRDSRALKPRGNSVSSRWTNITGSL